MIVTKSCDRDLSLEKHNTADEKLQNRKLCSDENNSWIGIQTGIVYLRFRERKSIAFFTIPDMLIKIQQTLQYGTQYTPQLETLLPTLLNI